ncbi:MAG TPA: J domain-containing protein [Candidatus Limnocylindrales bacterium]|nr:J domain-containing protein [Candidatus Limnocylindrales bacterium]
MASGDAYAVLGVGRFAPWEAVRESYRALARRYHPDGTAPDAARMIEINAAYDCLERERRARTAGGRAPVGPGLPEAPMRQPNDPGPLLRRFAATRHVDSPVIDFGAYAGWRIAEVAEVDPPYLEWLSRHSSGIRFRAAILEVLGPRPDIGRRAAFVR